MLQFIPAMQYYSSANGLLSFIFNSILLYLVIICDKTMLGFYRNLLGIYVTISLLGSVINTTLSIVISVSEHGFVVCASRFSLLAINQIWGSSIIVIYCWELIALLIILAVSYFYRFCSICKPHWRIFSTRIGLFCIFFVSFVIFLLYGACALVMQPDVEKNRILGPIFQRHFGFPIENASYIGMVSYKNDEIDYEYLSVTVIRGGSFLSLSLFILICGLNVFFTLRKKFSDLSSVTSSKVLHQQQRMFVLLFMQTLIPISCMYVPLATGLLMSFLRIRFFLLCDIFSVLLPVAQLFDPIIVFCCVKDYQNEFLSQVKALCHTKSRKDVYVEKKKEHKEHATEM